jgi:hypothetical protein
MSSNPQDEQEGFLTRWSRRKSEVRKGEVLPEPADEPEGEPQDAGQALQDAPPSGEPVVPAPGDEEGQAPAETATELPPLESLGEDSDYSAFMGEGVPQDLRQKALKKLFHSPKFNVRDGLDDYDWDFTNPEPLGDIVTAEMRYRIERELERLAGLDEDEEKPEDATAVAAVEAGEHDETDDREDPEADDERSEPA